MNYPLADKLLQLNTSLTSLERVHLKLLLGLAAGGLAPNFEVPSPEPQARAFGTVAECLARLQPYSDRVRDDGIAWRGHPAFMTDILLSDLQAEAIALRPSAVRFDEHFLGTGAPIANRLALSRELTALVSQHAGPVRPTGIASFLFYDEPGQGIEPHIDTDIFSLNTLLMLQHRFDANIKPSQLVIFPPNATPKSISLQPGEMIIFFAGSVVHGRERMKEGEAVTIVTFGFQPEV